MHPARTSRTVETLACLALVGGLLTACGGGSDDGDTDGSTNDLAATCTDVLNGRDAEIVAAAQDASFAVLEAAVTGEDPDYAQLQIWHNGLEAGLEQLDDEIDALADADDTPAWETILAPLQERVDVYTERMELTEQKWPIADADSGDLVSPIEEGPERMDALDELTLIGSDCETLLSFPGVNPEFSEFLTSVAITCSAIVDRRRDLGWPTLQKATLDLILQVTEEEAVTFTDGDVDAMRQVLEEWQQTADDLAAIDGAVPNEPAWAEAQQLAQDRIEVFTARLEALESDDQAAIITAFTPGNLGVPGWPFQDLGLDLRDCRSIDA